MTDRSIHTLSNFTDSTGREYVFSDADFLIEGEEVSLSGYNVHSTTADTARRYDATTLDDAKCDDYWRPCDCVHCAEPEDDGIDELEREQAEFEQNDWDAYREYQE